MKLIFRFLFAFTFYSRLFYGQETLVLNVGMLLDGKGGMQHNTSVVVQLSRRLEERKAEKLLTCGSIPFFPA